MWSRLFSDIQFTCKLIPARVFTPGHLSERVIIQKLGVDASLHYTSETKLFSNLSSSFSSCVWTSYHHIVMFYLFHLKWNTNEVIDKRISGCCLLDHPCVRVTFGGFIYFKGENFKSLSFRSGKCQREGFSPDTTAHSSSEFIWVLKKNLAQPSIIQSQLKLEQITPLSVIRQTESRGWKRERENYTVF